MNPLPEITSPSIAFPKEEFECIEKPLSDFTDYAIRHSEWNNVQFINDYFSMVPRRHPDSVELNLWGRSVRVIGITEEERDQEFADAFADLLEPVVKKEDFFDAADEYIAQHSDLVHLVQRKREIAEFPHESDYFNLELFAFVLGEEFHKRIFPTVAISYCLKAEKVPQLRGMIGYYIKVAEEEGDLLRLGNALELEKRFSQNRDHVLDDPFLPELIPVTKRQLMEWPRIEKIKVALRPYLQIERLMYPQKEEMFPYFDGVIESLSEGSRAGLRNELNGALTYKRKLAVLKEFDLSKRFESVEDQKIFIDYFEVLLEQIAFYPDEMIESTVPEELMEFLENFSEEVQVKPYLGRGREIFREVLSLFIPNVRALLEKFKRQELLECLSELDRDPNTKSPFSPEFLELFKKHRFTSLNLADEFPLPEKRYLALTEMEMKARKNLSQVCTEAKVSLVFERFGEEFAIRYREITQEEDFDVID